MKKKMFPTLKTFIAMWLVLQSGFMVSVAQTGAAEKANNLKLTITNLNKEMEKAFNDNDMNKVAAFYSDDAEIAGENYSVQGRKNLDNYWLSLKDRGRGWKLDVFEIGGSGEFVYQLGKSDLKYLNRGKLDTAVTNFVLIWKLQKDGTYKIFKDYLTRMEFIKPK